MNQTPNQGMPTIALLIALAASLATWNVLSLAAAIERQRAAKVAEANLEQAERRWVACLHNAYFIVGTDIYSCRAKKSTLKTAQVIELSSANVVAF